MDINALLSPEDGGASVKKSNGDSSPPASPQKSSRSTRVRPAGGKRRTASGLSQEVPRSPDRRPAPPTHQPPEPQHHHQHPGYPLHSPPPANVSHMDPSSNRLGHADYHSLPSTSKTVADLAPSHQTNTTSQSNYADHISRPSNTHRPSSHPHMDTLADLAAAQQRQQTTRTSSANSISTLRGQDAHSHPQRPSLHSHGSGPAPISRGISRQSLADLTMAEAPSQTPPPRDIQSSALSEDESKNVNDLLSYLAENSYAYEQHVQLINLLHKGFLSHVTGDGPSNDPSSYVLLNEMRQAREAMDTRFAVGETIWVDWLADEVLLASNSDERIAVTELFQKAVQDEPASVKLWNDFVDWVSSNYAACNDLDGADHSNWSAEDKEMCRELFTKEMVVGTLQEAIAATKWRIHESHLLWNRYAHLVQEQFPANPTEADVKSLHSLFLQRLQVPHVAWDETRQAYWPVVSRFEGDAYEAVFEQVNKMAQPAQKAMGIRSRHEFNLARAVQSEDALQIHREFEKYLKSEKFQHNKPGPFDFDLRCGLYERALLYEPTNTQWWLDYVEHIVTASDTLTQSLLPLIERATRHCPWSGELWARRILQADIERKSRDEIESTKHRATNAGLLDIGGMEELVRMLQEWCSYLRRHAFRIGNAEDDIDTAEVGITMALEDVYQAGVKIYGQDFKGDPLWRLEQIQLKFYTEARRFDEAREIFRKLSKTVGHSYEFWRHYYNWELTMWGFDRFRDPKRFETEENGPNAASLVVQEALRQRNVECPDRVLQMYLDHFRLHESGMRLHAALAEGREYAARLTVVQAKEAEEAAKLAAQQQQYAEATEMAAETAPLGGEKRKREEDTLINGENHKKTKTDTELAETTEETSTAHVKRDREHNTITVKNLAFDIQESEIKRFFQDCGKTPSINIVRDEENNTSSATVEFETHEDVLAAKTRDGKHLEGREVSISSGVQNTLYVTNYPAEYEESNIRDLFKSYGEIVSIRLPSLKFNNRRRFCYVQFLTPEMAKAAEAAMDGTKLDAMHTLLAKISDPDRKKARSGALEEGREVFVKNLERETPVKEIEQLFEQHGKVEKFNLLRLMNNKLTGSGFFTYTTAEDAKAAVEALNNKPFHGRVLHVSLATPKGGAAPIDRAKAEDVIVKRSTAPSATPEPNGARRGSDVSMQSAPAQDSNHNSQEIRARKIAIFNLPDTVNDARIQAALEKFGPVVKIQLRREKNGAIVEFQDAKHAFHVRQGVDLHSLGADVTSGDVADLLAKPKKKKADGAAAGSSNGGGGASNRGGSLAFVPPAAARAGQGRGGRRGGLGLKRGGGVFGGVTGANKTAVTNAEGAPAAIAGGKKSNADFRSMLEASKKPNEAAKDNEEGEA